MSAGDGFALRAARAENRGGAACGGAAGRPRELDRAALTVKGAALRSASLRDGLRPPLTASLGDPSGARAAVEAESASTYRPGADQQRSRGAHGVWPVRWRVPGRSRLANPTRGVQDMDQAGAREAGTGAETGGGGVWFDALAHTVTVDGGWPRCVECGEEGSHEEHQPEALRALEAVAR